MYLLMKREVNTMTARKIWKKIKTYDPAEIVKRKFKLKGWVAEIADVIVSFLVASFIYFILMPAILGANPAAVVVQSCSMYPSLNVGDISVLQGVSFDDFRVQEITLTQDLDFRIEPNNIRQETTSLIFPDGQRLDINKNGDTLVYVSKISGLQLIHRAIAKVRATNGNFYITKGDANNLPDAAKVECSKVEGNTCTQFQESITALCTESDAGYPGCLGTVIKEDEVIGRQLFTIPLLGHVKLLIFEFVPGLPGYPGQWWCGL